MTDRSPPRVTTLVGDALRQAGTLVGQELRLLQIEVDGNVRALTRVVTCFGTAIVLILSGIFLLGLALLKGLAALIGSEILAALILGVPLAVIAVVLLMMGVERMSFDRLLPRRSRD